MKRKTETQKYFRPYVAESSAVERGTQPMVRDENSSSTVKPLTPLGDRLMPETEEEVECKEALLDDVEVTHTTKGDMAVTENLSFSRTSPRSVNNTEFIVTSQSTHDLHGSPSRLHRMAYHNDYVEVCDCFDRPVQIEVEAFLTAEFRNWCPKIVPLRFFLQDDQSIKIWNVVIDLMRSFLFYKFKITKERARYIMIRSFMELCAQSYELQEKHGSSAWMKVIKYRLAYFASFAKGSSMFPKSPFKVPHSVCPLKDKKITNYLFLLKKVDAFVYMSLVDTICRGVKKGADRPTQEDCHKASLETFKCFTESQPEEEAHFVTLEKDQQIYNWQLQGRTVDRAEVERQLIRTISELIPEKIVDLEWNYPPSVSSCVEGNINRGGQFMAIKNMDGTSRGQTHIQCEFPDIEIHLEDVLVTHPQPKVNYPQGDPIVRPDELDLLPTDLLAHKVVKMAIFNLGPVRGSANLDVEQLASYVLTQRSDIVLMSLAEALKTRGISKGRALESFLLKPLQQYFSKELGKSPVFSTTRTPITEQIVTEMFGDLPDDTPFVSGDYDNATNLIKSHFTKFALKHMLKRMLLDQMYPQLYRLAKRSLTENFVRYCWTELRAPTEEEARIQIERPRRLGSEGGEHMISVKKKLEGEQKEGQPMGKVLSFVVLCVINLAVCRLAMEIDQKKDIPLVNLKCLINGDDCCFPLSSFANWTAVTSVVGLQNSIGKTFHSRDFIEMNSRTFLRTWDNSFQKIPFINFGLLKGLRRSENLKESKATNDLTKLVSLGAVHRKLVKGFDHCYDNITELFIQYNYKLLTDHKMDGISWFLPEWIGGLGMDLGPKPDTRLSNRDRLVAGLIFANYTELRPKKLSELPNWLTHPIVEEFIESILYDNELLETEFDYSTAWLRKGTYHNEYEDVDIRQSQETLRSELGHRLWRDERNNGFFVGQNYLELQGYSKEEIAKVRPKSEYAHIMSCLRRNQKINRIAYRLTNQMSNPKRTDMLEWSRLIHQTIDKYRSFLLVRDNFISDNGCPVCETEGWCELHSQPTMKPELRMSIRHTIAPPSGRSVSHY